LFEPISEYKIEKIADMTGHSILRSAYTALKYNLLKCIVKIGNKYREGQEKSTPNYKKTVLAKKKNYIKVTLFKIMSIYA
jgi:hypothetical protein